MADATPIPTPDQILAAGWVVVRARPRTPVRVIEIVDYPGCVAGFLVHHDGPGIPLVCGSNVRPSPLKR